MGSLLHLITHPTSAELSAGRYLKAGGEALGVIVVISWIITYFTHREVIATNALKQRLGYNNVCVGLDTKPAAYFAAGMWPFVTYLNIRAAWLLTITEYATDDQHSSTAGKRLTLAGSIVFVLSSCLMAMIFLFPPEMSDVTIVWVHTGLFIQYIIGRLFCIAVQYFRNYLDESQDDLDKTSTTQWIYFYVYAFVSVALTILIVVNFTWYDFYRVPGTDKNEPIIPYYFTMACDYTWFACLALTSMFLPAQKAVHLANVHKKLEAGKSEKGQQQD